jgi:hypothetical protein
MKKILLSALCASVLSSMLFAGGDVIPEPVAEPMAVESTDGWNFHLAPMFLWAQAIDGSSMVGPTTAPLSIDFGDALDNLGMIFAVHFEANKGDWTLFSEYQYVMLIPSQELPTGGTMNIDFRDYIFELGGAYAFNKTESSRWEALGGLRYTKQTLKTTLQANGATFIDVSNNWTDFFVGLRNSYKISDKWLLLSRADIGGGDSDFIWNASIMADYRFNEWGSVFIGYKAMDYDYDNGEKGLSHYAYDATQHGPLLGLNIHW